MKTFHLHVRLSGGPLADKSISIVIPVYNGRRYLEELVWRIAKSTEGFESHEIIFVDDQSPDKSYEKISEIVAVNQSVKGYLLADNYGQQNAILCGLSKATGDYVVIIDDDLENPPEAIPAMYAEIKKGFEAVYALDIKPEDRGFLRKSGSFARDVTFRLLTKLPKGMKVCSFRMMSSELCKKVAAAEGRFVYISMEMLRHTTNISNIRIKYGKRKESGHSFKKLTGLILKLYIYYSGIGFLKRFQKPGPAYIIKKSTCEVIE
jgi:undecaprenyl-phosphate 4-deoxy-4-formamido-L-arabinose transferase